jgi:hypothetical protein
VVVALGQAAPVAVEPHCVPVMQAEAGACLRNNVGQTVTVLQALAILQEATIVVVEVKPDVEQAAIVLHADYLN